MEELVVQSCMLTERAVVLVTSNLASFPHIKAIDFSCNNLDEIEQFENPVVQEFYRALITRRRQRVEEEIVS